MPDLCIFGAADEHVQLVKGVLAMRQQGMSAQRRQEGVQAAQQDVTLRNSAFQATPQPMRRSQASRSLIPTSWAGRGAGDSASLSRLHRTESMPGASPNPHLDAEPCPPNPIHEANPNPNPNPNPDFYRHLIHRTLSTRLMPTPSTSSPCRSSHVSGRKGANDLPCGASLSSMRRDRCSSPSGLGW